MKNIHAAPTASMSAEVAEMWAYIHEKMSHISSERRQKALKILVNIFDIVIAADKINHIISGIAPEKQKAFRESIIQLFVEEISDNNAEETNSI